VNSRENDDFSAKNLSIYKFQRTILDVEPISGNGHVVKANEEAAELLRVPPS
jgi:hypothetical protein